MPSTVDKFLAFCNHKATMHHVYKQVSWTFHTYCEYGKNNFEDGSYEPEYITDLGIEVILEEKPKYINLADIVKNF